MDYQDHLESNLDRVEGSKKILFRQLELASLACKDEVIMSQFIFMCVGMGVTLNCQCFQLLKFIGRS